MDDGTFDLVVSALAMTHAADLDRAVTALSRAARPDGRVVVTEVHPFNAALGAHPNFSLDETTVGSIHNADYTISDYIRAFDRAGLAIVDLHEPAFREADADAMSAAFVAGLGQNAVAAFRAALIGIPMAVIWDLRKK
ncbi:MAG: methyltransferase domain-containing protein [Alphaproteobacteria bacterium]